MDTVAEPPEAFEAADGAANSSAHAELLKLLQSWRLTPADHPDVAARRQWLLRRGWFFDHQRRAWVNAWGTELESEAGRQKDAHAHAYLNAWLQLGDLWDQVTQRGIPVVDLDATAVMVAGVAFGELRTQWQAQAHGRKGGRRSRLEELRPALEKARREWERDPSLQRRFTLRAHLGAIPKLARLSASRRSRIIADFLVRKGGFRTSSEFTRAFGAAFHPSVAVPSTIPIFRDQLSLAEASDILGVEIRAVRDLVTAGRLRTPPGLKTTICAQSLNTFLHGG